MCQIIDRHTQTHTEGVPHLQYLAAVRGAVDVLTGLVHAQCHTVEQDHHDANPLEPRINRTGVKERSKLRRKGKAAHTLYTVYTLNWAGWMDG